MAPTPVHRVMKPTHKQLAYLRVLAEPPRRSPIRPPTDDDANESQVAPTHWRRRAPRERRALQRRHMHERPDDATTAVSAASAASAQASAGATPRRQ
jgi:hypothetical protein